MHSSVMMVAISGHSLCVDTTDIVGSYPLHSQTDSTKITRLEIS